MTTPSLSNLLELKSKYEEDYKFFLRKIVKYANYSNDVGVNMSIKEARTSRANLKIIEEAIKLIK